MAGVSAVSVAPAFSIGVLTANGATPSLSTDSIGCTDSGVALEEVTVEAQSRRPARVSSDGSVTLDATVTGRRMRAFGEADAMRWIGTAGDIVGRRLCFRVSVDGTEYSPHIIWYRRRSGVFLIISEAYSQYSMPSIISGQSGEIGCIHRICLLALASGRIEFSPRRGLSEGFAGWSM